MVCVCVCVDVDVMCTNRSRLDTKGPPSATDVMLAELISDNIPPLIPTQQERGQDSTLLNTTEKQGDGVEDLSLPPITDSEFDKAAGYVEKD